MLWLARVHVVLKPVVNDPEGQVIQGGLRQLGFDSVQDVRAGKLLEISLEAPTRSQARGQIDSMCRKLLANPVIEDYRFTLSERKNSTA